MIRVLLTATVSLLWLTGSCVSLSVHQSPRHLTKRPGNTLKMTCSHHDKKYDKIYWYRQTHGQQLQLIGFLSFKQALDVAENFNISGDAEDEGFLGSLAVRVEDTGLYYCAVKRTGGVSQAYFGGGTRLTVLDPNISVTEPTVKVLPPSTKECEDRNKKKKKTLVCVATRFYPDHVTVYWQVNNVNTTAGAGTDNKALWDKDSLYSITSRLRVPANDWHNPKNSFTCNVIFYNGTGNTTAKHTISGDLHGQIGGEITTDDYVKSTQTAKLAYSIFIAKSTFYGLVVMVMIWKFQGSSEKQI